ncbi:MULTISPECIES: XRE family transcriptional regulator [Clostridium]|uniref:XRE family transcriptional regulator n=1 Tax=Clostridium cibarium TaxID=2762247 RepID=A0ABR8PW82_9CLOT|nr:MULTISPECIES: XRE family transcriptional regulator [Clostridium]MBD7912446.1 XRE family transcriptional regulator [Clostridium cibarium]
MEKENGVKRFIDECFSGSRKACARKLQISESTLCRVINGSSHGGRKFLSKVISYCEKNKIDYRKYISF